MTDDEIDEIWDRLDNMFWDNKFKEVDDILKGIDIPNSSIELMLTYLTVTLPARPKLKYRKEFFNKVKEEIEKRNEMEDGLLSGLE